MPLLSLCACLALQQAATARGSVFEDLDGDGARGAGEPGIAGVRVSDGEEVVLTDADGRFALRLSPESERGCAVFLTKPSGYATPLGPDHLPRFYYLHRPEGSPRGLRYAGIEPTGPLPATIDLPLVRSGEPDAFEVLLFADTQPQSAAELDWVRDDVVATLVGSPARFGMTLGDVLYDDLSLFARYAGIVGTIGIPWYNVPGNHDVNFLAADDRHSLETFQRHFGPPYYAFEVGQAVFFVLDSIEYRGRRAGDSAPGSSGGAGDGSGDGGYVAALGARQLGWLEQELRHVPPEKLVVLAMHAPLVAYASPDSPQTTLRERRQLLELVSGREHVLIVAGHLHATEHHWFGPEDGFAGPGRLHQHVLATVSGSWWSGPLDARGIPVSLQRDGTPNGWHVLAVDGNAYDVRYRAAGAPAEEQMRIRFGQTPHPFSAAVARSYRPGEPNAGRIARRALSAATIVVNLFDGGPRSRLEFQIGDGPFLPLRREPLPDPELVELHARYPETFKPWADPIPSSHVFVAPLPADLAPGSHAVTVRAVDELGHEHRGHAVLEVTGP